MAEEKDGGKYRLELVGLQAGGQRPDMVVQVVDAKKGVVRTEKVAENGTFALPPDVLKKAELVIVGAADEKGGVAANASARFRASEFAALVKDGTLALAEGIWSRFLFHWECVSGSVRVCRRRPWWFDTLIDAVAVPLKTLGSTRRAARFMGAGTSALPFERFEPSVNDLLIWPYRCYPVCLGTVEVYRRTCCCWPIVIDDWRIRDLIRDLEIIVQQIPKRPPKFPPPPPPPPIDPLSTPIFKGGALNELALNAPADLRALRSLPGDQAALYVNSREYLLRRLCSCGTATRVATGTIQPDGTFNICWLEGLRLMRVNCHDEHAYVVKQTIGGTTTVIYDGLTAGAWFGGANPVVLTSYNGNAFTCAETGDGDGTAYVYLDLIGDTESHQLTTPASTGWDRVAAPTGTSGLLFPNPTGSGHLRNLGGSLELTFKFSEGMKAAAVGAHFYRVSISKADAAGNPVGTRYYYGQGLHPSGDGLTWQKAVITGGGVDIVPDTLGPVTVAVAGGTEKYLYRIPYDSDEEWTGSVRHHALVHTLFNAINVPGAADLASEASNHLITLEVFNAAGDRLRPLGVPASGQPGNEVAKAFKFRRWFQPGGSVGDDTVEVPFAALTHLFCWDNRRPEADITRLVENGSASNQECQFLEEPADSTFGIEYSAYVPDERFQHGHSISWIRGLNGDTDNGGVGTLPTPLSPGNVGKPLDPPQNSGTNTFGLMLTRINPDDSTTLLQRCSFAVTLTTWAKTTDGANFSYPHDDEVAAFALQIS